MEHRDIPENVVIDIVGAQRMQNELLAYFVGMVVGVDCDFKRDIKKAVLQGESVGNGKAKIVFVDCAGKTLSGLLNDLKRLDLKKRRTRVALFNMARNQKVESECLRNGIRGFFYKDDSVSNLVTGLRFIINGGIWASRAIMAECIDGIEGIQNGKLNLTSRQIEILHLLQTGASNIEISLKLDISTHTVKSHLRVIFQLIKVANRAQATAWASRNLHL